MPIIVAKRRNSNAKASTDSAWLKYRVNQRSYSCRFAVHCPPCERHRQSRDAQLTATNPLMPKSAVDTNASLSVRLRSLKYLPTERENRWAGLASRRTSVRFRFGSPFSSKVVVCGHCLVTLSLTINEILIWLSSLPIVMQKSFWWWQCSDRYIISFFPHLHTPFSPSLRSLMVSVDVKHWPGLLREKVRNP